MSRTSSALALVILVLAGCGQGGQNRPAEPVGTTTAAPSEPTITTQMIDVGGRKLALYCAGQGSPTVVLEHGLGLEAGDFGDALAEISQNQKSGEPTSTRVCSYDRAGRGKSDPIAGIRTGEDFASDLDRLLAGADIDRPVVLVGHSIAGLHLRLFADRHPDDVAAMVLIDVVGPDDARRFQKLLPRDAGKDGPVVSQLRKDLAADLRPGHADNDERLDAATTCAQVRRTGTLGDLPLVVLTAGEKRFGRNWSEGELSDKQEDQFQLAWEAIQRELPALSTNSVHIVVPNAGHIIWKDQPDVVWGAVRSAVKVARDGGRIADHAPKP
jgi:pimeloyl-ACP methyl ester carboxylesterase